MTVDTLQLKRSFLIKLAKTKFSSCHQKNQTFWPTQYNGDIHYVTELQRSLHT